MLSLSSAHHEHIPSQQCHDIRELFFPHSSTVSQDTQGNLIYLAMLTERVPIIGPFTPSHAIAGRFDTGDIYFSEVFDMDYLSKVIGIPVLEWRDVKKPSSNEIEDIGCWSVWQATQTRESEPRFGNAIGLQGLGEWELMLVI